MSRRLSELVIIIIGMTDNPIANSYLIICEEARTAPNKEYLLLEAHPPIIIPYTPSETTPKEYRMPIFKSAICKENVLPSMSKSFPQGITAYVIKAVHINKQGDKRKSVLSAAEGKISSLKKLFTPSAIGCSIPLGPARSGPMRS